MTHGRLRQEMERVRRAIAGLDRQVLFILVLVPFLVIVQQNFGSRALFREHLADPFPIESIGILSWAWWFGVQGVLGFVVPVLALVLIFRRKPREIGLGLGDWKFATVIALAYVPLVVVGTWFLSDSPDFQAKYPHFGPAARDWGVFVIYQALFLFYWIGWEYLWRGFMIFGTARVFGVYAIFIQTIPFALLHLNKPLPESLLSIVGGIALGGLVWRCRSFWIAVPIHFVQMLILDTWCTLRARTGVDGTGLDALWRLLSGG